MNDSQFSIIGALKKGWELTKANFLFLVLFQLVTWGISSLPLIYSNNFSFKILIAVLDALTTLGFLNSALLISKGIRPNFTQLYSNWNKLTQFIIGSLIFFVLSLGGLILFVIPGLYVWSKFGLFPYYILEKDIGAIEAFKEAGRASEGFKSKLCSLYLVTIGLNLLGVLFFGIGTLVTFPVTVLAITSVYPLTKAKELVTQI